MCMLGLAQVLVYSYLLAEAEVVKLSCRTAELLLNGSKFNIVIGCQNEDFNHMSMLPSVLWVDLEWHF